MGKVPWLSIVAAVLLGVAGCRGSSSAAPAEGARNGASAASAVAGRRGVDADGARDADDARGASAEGVDEGAATERDAQRTQAEQARKDDKRPVLVCFGDSLTAGLGTGPGQSYPDYLQGDLDAQAYRYRVVNEGISGNTTKDGVERLSEVLALKPKIAVVEFGGNDGLRGQRIEDSEANLDEMVHTLQGAGVEVALAGITLPPDYGEDYIRQFDAMYTDIAKKYRVPMLPFLLENVYGVPGMMQRDQTHATAKGNVVVARNVFHLVQPLLTKGK